MVNTNFTTWSANQKILRGSLGKDPAALDLLLTHHAQTHQSAVAKSDYSFADVVWDGLSEAAFRCIPPKGEHSIAWCIWHLARIEDTAMNVLVADEPQLLHEGDWNDRLGIAWVHCGNEMSDAEMTSLSATIKLATLRDYRIAVGCRTQAIIDTLSLDDIKRKVDPVRIQRVLDEGAIQPEAAGITDYWRKRTIAGLLLMPATRHNMVHINEALTLKKKCK